MWGWITGEQIRNAMPTVRDQTPEEAEELRKKVEMEKIIQESGQGICQYCGQEIWRNDNMNSAGWVWESEEMVGWCDAAGKGNKHSPRLF